MPADNQPDLAIFEKLIESVVAYIIRKEDLLQELDNLLTLGGFKKKGETSDKSDISKLLMEKPVVIKDAMDLILEDSEKNKVELAKFLEQQVNVEGMEKELEALGNQLLDQGLISGAAVTTLTGALAGLLTVGGVTGALIGGGAAFVGFVALVAIAAIGYLIYQNRGEIKEGAVEAGKAVKRAWKSLQNIFPTIKAREKNFDRLRSELLAGIVDDSKLKAGQSIEYAKNQNKIVEMLQNQEQQSAIVGLIKDGDIQGFSEKDMERLLRKGLSTHKEDMEEPQDKKKTEKEDFFTLMDKLQSAIMAIGSDIEVKQKVNEKVEAMKEPSSKVKESNSKQVDGNNVTK